jgi:hypothetical protein
MIELIQAIYWQFRIKKIKLYDLCNIDFSSSTF